MIRRGAELFGDLGATVDIRNEARVHLRYEQKFGVPSPPYASTEAAIATFPSTSSAFGIRPRGGELEVSAPYGFTDLFALRTRPNPLLAPREVYESKTARWRQQWPDLEVLPWPADESARRGLGSALPSPPGSSIASMAGRDLPFDVGVSVWRRNLGSVRDVVRQELVARQLREHLPRPGEPRLQVLDVGCGEGTQALRLARLGHTVLGVDVSERLLADARAAAAGEPPAVQRRLAFERADFLSLGPELEGRFDLVSCHGVAMYLPSLGDAVAALVAAARPGGLLSLLTRNQAGIAMRAGMSRDWQGALESFDARTYTNRLGVEEARAQAPAEVRQALADHGAQTVAWYGVRLFSDHWATVEPPEDVDALVAAEEEAGRRDPYRSLAALTHTIARVAAPAA